MINIEIDDKRVQVENGSTVIEAASQVGVYIPHFCYHKKLTIASSCRVCLVLIENVAKPIPACSTVVVEGMRIFTATEKAVKAQNGVMEFLLINHPLDCPICDQGGACELQDQAVGYGGEKARYREEKRVVPHKNIGPLVSAEEMSRCIGCTRCVRFGQEIAGIMELGQANRSEFVEIMTFVERSVTSELSGNMIDLCPVGALTSKPFRYKARNWELSRRKSISPHDGLGSGLAVQVKNNKVMRVLPIENEDVNECWLSDKDRFSYEGLNSSERLTKPMIKQDGKWHEVEWQAALEYVANGLSQIADGAGKEQIGALATPHSTLEELFLLQKLVRGLGSENIDFRLRQNDFSSDGKQAGAPWLGMPISNISKADRMLVVGSFLRKDHPLLAQRIRQAVKKGSQVNIIHSVDDDLLMRVANKLIVSPGELVSNLAQVLKAVSLEKQVPVEAALIDIEVSANASEIAKNLLEGKSSIILLGNFAQFHPQASQLQLLALKISAILGGKFGFLGEAANSVGGYLANAVPGAKGLNASEMLAKPRKAYVLLNTEPEFDCANPQLAMSAMGSADFVVALSSYKHHALDYAKVLLPIAPFTETSGTFVSTEGRVQSFKGAVKPLGDSRPAWKVLRVLGSMLKISGFEYQSNEDVLEEIIGKSEIASKLNNSLQNVNLNIDSDKVNGLQRIAEVSIYSADAIVRRASSLQLTKDAIEQVVTMHSDDLVKIGVQSGDKVKVNQGQGSVQLRVITDDRQPRGTVRVAAGNTATSALGAMFGTVNVERA